MEFYGTHVCPSSLTLSKDHKLLDGLMINPLVQAGSVACHFGLDLPFWPAMAWQLGIFRTTALTGDQGDSFSKR